MDYIDSPKDFTIWNWLLRAHISSGVICLWGWGWVNNQVEKKNYLWQNNDQACSPSHPLPLQLALAEVTCENIRIWYMFYDLRCNNTIKCYARIAVHEILQEPTGFWNLDRPNCSTHKKATTGYCRELVNQQHSGRRWEEEGESEGKGRRGGRRREKVKGGWKREFIGRNGRREEEEGGKQGNKERGRLYLYFILCNRKCLLNDVTYSLYQV